MQLQNGSASAPIAASILLYYGTSEPCRERRRINASPFLIWIGRSYGHL